MSTTEIAAGPDLDAEIARRVFGFWLARHPDGLMDGDEYWWTEHPTTDGSWCYASVALPRLMGPNVRYRDGLPKFSTDIAAAWAVVERCTEIGGKVAYRDVNGLPVATWFMAHFENAHIWSCSSPEAAEAICRAALAALDGQPVRR